MSLPCTHVLMYSCTHILSVEPDLCEVANAARPAEQVAFQGAVWCFSHIVFDFIFMTGDSDDSVLISVT